MRAGRAVLVCQTCPYVWEPAAVDADEFAALVRRAARTAVAGSGSASSSDRRSRHELGDHHHDRDGLRRAVGAPQDRAGADQAPGGGRRDRGRLPHRLARREGRVEGGSLARPALAHDAHGRGRRRRWLHWFGLDLLAITVVCVAVDAGAVAVAASAVVRACTPAAGCARGGSAGSSTPRGCPGWLRACGLTVADPGQPVTVQVSRSAASAVQPKTRPRRDQMPAVVGVRSGPSWDEVRVRLVPGQTPEDFDDAARALAVARGVARCQVRELAPQLVSIDFQRCDRLGRGRRAASASPTSLTCRATAIDLRRVWSGRTEYGTDWLPAAGRRPHPDRRRHRRGKNSVGWCPIVSIAPAIRDGLVRVSGIDPKGMELAYGRRIFSRYAVTGKDALALLDDLDRRHGGAQGRVRRPSAHRPGHPGASAGAAGVRRDRRPDPLRRGPQDPRSHRRPRRPADHPGPRARATPSAATCRSRRKDTVPVRELFPAASACASRPSRTWRWCWGIRPTTAAPGPTASANPKPGSATCSARASANPCACAPAGSPTRRSRSWRPSSPRRLADAAPGVRAAAGPVASREFVVNPLDLRKLDRAPVSVRPPYDVRRPHAWDLEANRLDYLAALREPLAGLDLGAYDDRMIAWLAGWDVPTVGAFASLLHRSGQRLRSRLGVLMPIPRAGADGSAAADRGGDRRDVDHQPMEGVSRSAPRAALGQDRGAPPCAPWRDRRVHRPAARGGDLMAGERRRRRAGRGSLQIYQRASDGLSSKGWLTSTRRAGSGGAVRSTGAASPRCGRSSTGCRGDSANGVAVPDRLTTVGEYLDHWIRRVQETKRATTHRGYESAVHLHIRPVLGAIRLDRLSGADVRRLVAISRAKCLCLSLMATTSTGPTTSAVARRGGAAAAARLPGRSSLSTPCCGTR